MSAVYTSIPVRFMSIIDCPRIWFTQFLIHTRMYFPSIIICLLVYVRYKILSNATVINFAPLHQLLFSIFSHAHPEANGRLPICEGINDIIYFILHYPIIQSSFFPFLVVSLFYFVLPFSGIFLSDDSFMLSQFSTTFQCFLYLSEIYYRCVIFDNLFSFATE